MESTTGSTGALVTRRFTKPGVDPFGEIAWSRRDAWTLDSKYHVPDVEAPESWSDNAVNITSKLYLSKAKGREEKSVAELVGRVAAKITVEGVRGGYFGSHYPDLSDCDVDMNVKRRGFCDGLLSDVRPKQFYDELRHIMINQLAVFNSPVLFNVGRDDRPQNVSACYILGVEDTTESIMETAHREAFIFKGGSGSGFDISRLRGMDEALSTGGTASGPVSFMRLFDAGAGTFKSGGTTRRAAKEVKCDLDHPDIRDFITCKAREEDRIALLLAAGVHLGFDEEGERNMAECTSFQNANIAVGATNEFMTRATSGLPTSDWELIARKTGGVVAVDDAKELLDLLAQCAWRCADPGILFMDTANAMHTAPMLDGKASPIRSGNPCMEFLHNDDTSCNLGSVNVLKFLHYDESLGHEVFDVEGFRHTVDIMALAMEICVSFADFPDDKLTYFSQALRPLGLGYSNMGAAIMAQGFPYDSDDGREFAASVTALLTGRVYRKSAEVAALLGPFHYWEENRDAMLGVIERHIGSLVSTTLSRCSIWDAAYDDWTVAQSMGKQFGFRNSQATVVAPAGTTSYFLDCDTTGIEPAFEHKIFKSLAGGGHMTIINQSLMRAADSLGGYDEDNLLQIADGDFSCVSPEDQATFHTANQISAEGHIKMIAAVQPFVSGAISKTINMPADATVDDVKAAYVLAWQLGCKDLAIYRNGSKSRQPHAAQETPSLDVKTEESLNSTLDPITDIRAARDTIISLPSVQIKGGQDTHPSRRRLPRTRDSRTHKIHLRGQVGEYEGYVQAGKYPDGRLGEVFIEGFGKQGSFTQTALAAMATAYSIAIQYGTPWEIVARKFLNVSDETGGMVVPDPEASGPPAIRSAKSIIDYIARWLVLEFGDVDLHEEFGVRSPEARERVDDGVHITITVPDPPLDVEALSHQIAFSRKIHSNGHSNAAELGAACASCGTTMRRTGGCWTCPGCYATSGCG